MSWVAWSMLILIVIVCLLLSAFVSGSEIAYFGLTPQELEDLEQSEDATDKRAFNLISHSERLLATILITNNLVNITMVVLLTFAINKVVTFNSDMVSFLVQTVFMTFLLLLFGEIFPKLVARGRTLWWVRMAASGVTFFYKAFGPLSRIMVKSTFIVNRVVTKKEENISADELGTALEISDVKDSRDKEMLEGILSFGEKNAREIMISRVDITSIESHDSWPEVRKVIIDSGYSRIPVYDHSEDSICGILYSKDLLPYMDKATDDFKWQDLLREAYFVPESRMIDDLLEDFRKRKIHIAIVIDEYGCTQGIVTLEDIIEQIVGAIPPARTGHLYIRREDTAVGFLSCDGNRRGNPRGRRRRRDACRTDPPDQGGFPDSEGDILQIRPLLRGASGGASPHRQGEGLEGEQAGRNKLMNRNKL